MQNSFYKDSIVLLEGVIAEIMARLDIIRKYKIVHNDRDPIEYITSRVKTEESMKEKLKRKKLPINLETALTKIYDAAGIRIICAYIDDVYTVVKMLKKFKDLKILKEKNYIKNPKSNGYRSYHIVFQVPLDIAGEVHPVNIEIQIRTIAMDFWASLDHKIRYKFQEEIPSEVQANMQDYALDIQELDRKMYEINKIMSKYEKDLNEKENH